MVHFNIEDLASRAELKAPDNGLDVLLLAECSLLDRRTLMELRQVLINKRSEAEPRVTEACRPGREHVCWLRKILEALCMEQAR